MARQTTVARAAVSPDGRRGGACAPVSSVRNRASATTPDIGDAELRAALFLHFYGRDFEPAERRSLLLWTRFVDHPSSSA
jgi:hypothetical protein